MKRLIWLALLLACIVVPLGAYVRLSQAGLGCPDWPGCYGQLSPAHAADDIAQAQATAPDGPVSAAKAWKEMTHRYLAGVLGLSILALAGWAWRTRERSLAALLSGVICLQALLGMLTVTRLLKPAIVSAHLLGGMTVAALLAWWALGVRRTRVMAPAACVWLARAALLALFCQIALGGWVSSNYAALACQGFPSCNGSLWPAMSFEHAFHLWRELGAAPDGSALDPANLVAIHWLHRLGALALSLLLLSLLWQSRQVLGLGPARAWLLLAWLAQIGLGVSNVLFQLPLPVAVAHNAGALALLLALLNLLGRMQSAPLNLPVLRLTPRRSKTWAH